MIGQCELVSKIVGQVSRNRFPRFSILIGEKGSGKKLLAREIAGLINAKWCYVPISVDDIRECIVESYKLIEPVVYIIPDCDNMSGASANALLKVTEEPPQKAYFILTCESADNLLTTIKSRGVTYMLEPYTYEDKCDYLNMHEHKAEEDETFILNVASNIGEIAELLDIDVSAFNEYVNLVVDNIAEVSGSNAFKIGDRINFKDDATKYDLRLFLRAFSSVCVDRMLVSDNPLMYAQAVAITGDTIQELHIRGINKQMVFDTWTLSIREIWL